jgi:acetylornithine deacetylase/succinyl-diaminopimelate desuccinylase-like protein
VIGVGKQGSPLAEPAASEAEGFRVVKDAIHGTFSDVVAVVPALTPHPTGARYFSDIAGGVYGFTPFRIVEENLGTIHGEGERVRVSGYLDAIRFYAELVRRGTE